MLLIEVLFLGRYQIVTNFELKKNIIFIQL